MPLERVKQGFKDISATFKISPMNNDLLALKDSAAIARSLRNIVFTNRGEKFFNPDFGSDLKKSLFENLDEVTALTIKEEIEYTIVNYESRVDLLDLAVVPDYDNNEYFVTIVYNIIGLDVPPQQLEFVLLPSR
jgi:hypothetical protein|tara:strand:+ start:1081 stop:1482 length:402 start_codon:yes stop_codon:yes gene_type:complete